MMLFMGWPRQKLEAEHTEILAQCMRQAVINILGNSLEIRLDIEHHRNGEVWIEEKGEKYYNLLSKYLDKMENRDDRRKLIIRSVFT